MKVLIFMTQFSQLSGAERLAVELAQELNKRGVHADILSMYSEEFPGASEARQRLIDSGIPNVHFLGLKVHPPLASLLPAILKLRRLLSKQQYDIVETSMVSPTVIAAWATLISRTRLVVGVHQVFRRDRENLRQHRFWRLSVRFNPRIRYYGISNYVSAAWVDYSGARRQHTRTVYNAIPDDCFDATPDRQGVRAELGIPEDCRIAIYVGRLAKYKACDVLLNALGPVLEQNDLSLLYVGALDPMIQGSTEMLQQMKAQIASEGWGERVKFIDYRNDIPRLLASSDVLTHPTRMEGFGLTLVEAMAAGLPVVASDAEGIPEVLAGTDSTMVPPDDVVAFREAALRVLERSSDEKSVALERGRKRAEGFGIDRRIDAMTQLFADVRNGSF